MSTEEMDKQSKTAGQTDKQTDDLEETDMVAASRHKDFGTPNKISDYAPLTFSVAGETFECRPAIQGKVLLDFISNADSYEGGRSADAIRKFFSDAMVPEECTRFMTLIEDSDYLFDMEELTQITAWLVEQYSQRPKELLRPSSAGRKRSGNGSMAAAS